jgi:REP element-mobilizing transposase RayT
MRKADELELGGRFKPNTTTASFMAQSLANIVLHLIFSTKYRRPLLRDDQRNRLHSYIAGILTNHKSHLIEINSVADHIHILFAQSKILAPAKLVEQVKSSSSSWLKDQQSWYADFAWQVGYGEFSVSPKEIEGLRDYIRSQPEHHKKEDFQSEFRGICERNGVSLDERYGWD